MEIFSRRMYSQTSSSVQERSGWIRTCVSGPKEAWNWSQSSGGWSLYFHSKFLSRGEKTRSLARDPPPRPLHPRAEPLLVPADDQVHAPFAGYPVAVHDHPGVLVVRVDVDEREGNPAEERLAGQPQHRRRILPDRPQHREIPELAERLANDVDALVLQGIEVVHAHRSLFLRPRARGSTFRIRQHS